MATTGNEHRPCMAVKVVTGDDWSSSLAVEPQYQ